MADPSQARRAAHTAKRSAVAVAVTCALLTA